VVNSLIVTSFCHFSTFPDAVTRCDDYSEDLFNLQLMESHAVTFSASW